MCHILGLWPVTPRSRLAPGRTLMITGSSAGSMSRTLTRLDLPSLLITACRWPTWRRPVHGFAASRALPVERARVQWAAECRAGGVRDVLSIDVDDLVQDVRGAVVGGCA